MSLWRIVSDGVFVSVIIIAIYFALNPANPIDLFFYILNPAQLIGEMGLLIVAAFAISFLKNR